MMFDSNVTIHRSDFFSENSAAFFIPSSSLIKFQKSAVSLRNLDQKSDFVNTLMKKSLKHKKEYMPLKNFIFCKEIRF